MTIERRLSPEEEELRTKQAELDGVLGRLAQNELEPETLHAEINFFFSTYNAAVLPNVAEAKGLRAHIAQAIVLDPTDTARSESQEARASADEAEGGSPGDIVKIPTYVTSINDWRASALEHQSLFGRNHRFGGARRRGRPEMSAVYSPHVKFLHKWGTRGGGDGEFRWPLHLVIDGAGNVYVSECSNDRIQVFDPQGRFLRNWGSEGSGEGEFRWPQGLAIDNEGNVYVSDQGNDRLQVFDPQGRFLRKWGALAAETGNSIGLRVLP